MAMTRAARSSSLLVSAPRPGPISITRSAGSGQTARAIRSRIELATRKCCPSFCGTPPSTPQATGGGSRLEDDLFEAPGGLTVDSGRCEPGEQNQVRHFVGQLTAREVIVLHV